MKPITQDLRVNMIIDLISTHVIGSFRELGVCEFWRADQILDFRKVSSCEEQGRRSRPLDPRHGRRLEEFLFDFEVTKCRVPRAQANMGHIR
jgi:hypothetical protein